MARGRNITRHERQLDGHRGVVAGAHRAALPSASTLHLPGRDARLGNIDHDVAIDSVPGLRGRQVALVSLVGSRAYGLHTADSDADYRGFYVAGAHELLGLAPPPEQIDSSGEVDLCVYELGKFAHLALAGNPNILEVLWADALRIDDAGAAIVDAREAFLSERVRDTYIGYAVGQMKRALRGQGDAQYTRRRAKAIRHLFRLAEQGETLLRDGTLTVAVSDPERIRAMGELDDAALQREFETLKARLQAIPTDLPPEPDRARIEELVREIRLATLPR